MALHRNAVLVNDELGEVPLDQIHQEAALLFFHVLPDGVRLLSIHLHLLEQVKLHLAVPHKALDRLVVARLLVRKLVAGERQNTQSCNDGGGEAFQLSVSSPQEERQKKG